MAPRPQWKGHLKLSLVTCAVALYPAISSTQRTRFNTLNRATGHRVRRQFVDAETADVVETEEQVRGYEVGKGSYVLIEDEDIDSVALESTHTIDIDRFVDRQKVDRRYLDTAYYLAPNDAIAQQAFAVMRDAMEQKSVVGLARVVLMRRERLLMLEPYLKGMLVTTLRYNYEVRDAEPYFADIQHADVPKEMLQLATHIIDTKTGDFDLAGFEDRYENALVAMIREKQKGMPIERRTPASPPSNVVDLMEALRRSLSGNSASDAKPKPAAKTSSRKTTPPARGKPKASKGRLKKAG